VQNQQKIEWPSQLIVAKAYLDQVTRSQALPPDQIASVEKAIRSAEKSHMNAKKVAALKGMSAGVEAGASTAKTSADATRLHALAEILQHPVA
jgi:hypothetical protein